MDIPENAEADLLTQSYAAPQRGGDSGTMRARGPHPLPVFLHTVASACEGGPDRLRRVLAGLRRYQSAPAAAPRPMRQEVARVGAVSLRSYGGTGRPLVLIPSLINPPTVLDLAPGNSFLDGLAVRGVRPLLVDWGPTEAAGLEELVTARLVPLIETLGEPVALAGYCLGGTLAVAAAALLGPNVTQLALLATPWNFGGYGPARAGLADWWESAGPLSEQLGVLPIDLLQPAFWSLDPAGLAAKYARFADLPEGPEVAAFVTLEDWSNTGQPLSLAAARGLAEDLFAADLPGRGAWQVGGQTVDPTRLSIPILDVVARRDRIVPPGAALSSHGIGTPLGLDAGHVGMIVGRHAPTLLWDPLAKWLLG